MTRFEVDRACGQTPCLCGDIEAWHPACFAGKSVGQIEIAYDRAYRIARAKLRQHAAQQVGRALYSDRHQQAAEALAASVIAKAANRRRPDRT